MVTAAQALSVYDEVTARRTRHVRVDELCRKAGAAHPEWLPGGAELTAEARFAQRDKKGLEKAQGYFLSHVLADPAAGAHLCHAMLLPREASLARRAEYEKAGELDLGAAHIKRQGKAAIVTMRNPR